MGNPIDDYLEIRTEKTAGVGDFFRAAASAPAFAPEQVGVMAKHTLAVAGGAVLAAAARKAYMAATKSLHHKQMLEVNPDLAEHQQADPKMFNQHYSSLRNMNPHFAQDPVVAGAYMRRMSEFPHNAGPILVESLKEAPKPGGLKDYSSAMNLAQRVAPKSQQENQQQDSFE